MPRQKIISKTHKIVGLEDPAVDFYITKLLVGIQKKTATVHLRRPIDLKMLSNLVAATKAIISDKFTELCIAAMVMLAFHGFLRIGEISLRPGISSQYVLQRSDLVIVTGRNTSAKQSLQLTISHAKHQQVNRPVVLQITSQPNKCPVATITRYLRIRGTSAGPLFIFPDNRPITRSFFASQLSACLLHAGYDPTFYKCHSFRIGSATTAASRGFTEVQIQAMRRWKSSAFRRYIRIPMMQL